VVSLARNTAWLTLSKLFSVGVFAAFGLVLPRMVSVQLNGLYTLMSTLLFFGSMAATFGVPTILIRTLAREPKRSAQLFADGQRALCLGALLSGLMVLLYLLIEMQVQGQIQSQRLLLGGIVAAVIFFDALGGLGEALFQSREEMKVPALFDVLSGVVRAGGGIGCLLWLSGHQAILGVFLCFLCGSMMRAYFLHRLVQRHLPSDGQIKSSNRAAWALVRESFGVATFRLMRMLRNRFDAILLGLLIVPALGMSPEESADLCRGFYGTAMRVIFVFHTFTMALNTAIYPRIARLAGAQQDLGDEFRRVVRYQAWWVAPLAAAVFIWANPLAGWFGEEYRNGIDGIHGTTAQVLKILAGAVLLDCIGGPVGMLLVSSKQMDRKLPVFGAIFAATSIILNIILIPRYGMIGAAWSSVGAALVEFFLKAHFAKLIIGNYRHLREMIPYLLLAGAIGALANHYLAGAPIFGVLLSGLLYIMLSFFFGLVDPGIKNRLLRK